MSYESICGIGTEVRWSSLDQMLDGKGQQESQHMLLIF